jgi:hypothetical protein
MFKRLGGALKKVEKSSLQKTKNIRKSSQIEATTAETKPKNRKPKKMKKEIAIIKSAVLGTLAFKNGKKSIPAHDSELLKLIGENNCTIDLLNAWINSWHAANLAA